MWPPIARAELRPAKSGDGRWEGSSTAGPSDMQNPEVLHPNVIYWLSAAKTSSWGLGEIQANNTQNVVFQVQRARANERQSLARNPEDFAAVQLLRLCSLGLALITLLRIFLNKNKIAHRGKSGTNFIYSIFSGLIINPWKSAFLV